MDEYLDGRISRLKYLIGHTDYRTNNFKRDYPFIGKWLADQSDYISWIADRATPEDCVDVITIGWDGMMKVWEVGGNPFTNISQQSYEPFEAHVLVDCVENERWTALEWLINNNGPIMPCLGYFTIRAVALERANIDCRKNKTLSALLSRHENDPRFVGRFHFVVDQYGTGVPFPLGGAMAEMFKITQSEFGNLTNTKGMQISQDINSELGEQIMNRVPDEVGDAIVAAMKGDEKMIGIPLKAASRKIDSYNDMQKNKSKRKKKNLKMDTNDWGFDGLEIGKTKPQNDGNNHTDEWSSRAQKFRVAEIFTANEEFKRDSRKTRSTSRQAKSYRKRKFEKEYLPESE